MLVNKEATREWAATDFEGIERSLFRNKEGGGRPSVVRLARGSAIVGRTLLMFGFTPVSFTTSRRN